MIENVLGDVDIEAVLDPEDVELDVGEHLVTQISPEGESPR